MVLTTLKGGALSGFAKGMTGCTGEKPPSERRRMQIRNEISAASIVRGKMQETEFSIKCQPPPLRATGCIDRSSAFEV